MTYTRRVYKVLNRAGGVAEYIEDLPSRYKDVSSNPVPPKQNKQSPVLVFLETSLIKHKKCSNNQRIANKNYAYTFVRKFQFPSILKS
jgi:hypothetical protein